MSENRNPISYDNYQPPIVPIANYNTDNYPKNGSNRPKQLYLALFLLIPIMILVIAPALNTIISSFSDSVFNRFGVNPMFVGFENYKAALSDSKFVTAMKGSQTINLIAGVALLLLGYLSILIAPALKNIQRGLFFILCLIPSFVLDMAWPDGNSSHGVEADIAYIATKFLTIILQNIGPVVLFCGGMAVLFSENRTYKDSSLHKFSGLIIYAVSIFAKILTVNSTVFALYFSPTNKEFSSTIDKYIYETLSKYVSPAANSAWVIRTFIQVILCFIGLIILRHILFKDKIEIEAQPKASVFSPSIIILFAIVGFATAIVGLFILGIYPEIKASNIVSTLSILIVGMLIIGTFATLTYLSAQSEKGWLVGFLFVAVSCLTPNIIGVYSLVMKVGLINVSVAPAIFSSLQFTIFAAMAFLSYAGGKRALPYVIALGGLSLTYVLNDLTFSRLFLSDRTVFSAALTYLTQLYIRFGSVEFPQYLIIGLVVFSIGVGIAFCGVLFQIKPKEDSDFNL